MTEKINAIQNYLNIYRSMTNMKKILHSAGIYIDMDYGSGKKEETLHYHICSIYKDLDAYTFEILGIDRYDEVVEVFTNMATQYAYGDDTISAEGILSKIENTD